MDAQLLERIERIESIVGLRDALEEVHMPQASVAAPHNIDRGAIEDLILDATRDSNLTRFQKNRIERVLTSRFRVPARERLVDQVTQDLIDEGALVITPEGTQAAIDPRAIIEAIQKWLPVLLQILSLFGV